MFRKRIERAFNYAKEKRVEREADLPEDEEEAKAKLEKGDLFALIVSAYGIILPVAIVVLIVMMVLGYWFIFR